MFPIYTTDYTLEWKRFGYGQIAVYSWPFDKWDVYDVFITGVE